MIEQPVLVGITSIERGCFVPTEKPIDRDGLVLLLDRLFALDQGYLEVRLAGADFPVLMVGFRKGFAVVQCMFSAESMALLFGDQSVPASELVDVLIMDGLAAFTGEYVMELARARDVLLQFVGGAAVPSLGDWYEL